MQCAAQTARGSAGQLGDADTLEALGLIGATEQSKEAKQTNSITLKKYSFEILYHVATLGRKEDGETLELNIAEYAGEGIGLDLRRWRNGKPIRGMRFGRDEIKKIYTSIQKGLDMWEEFPEELKIEAKNETPLKLSEAEAANLYNALFDMFECADDDEETEGGEHDDEEAGDAETARNQ